MLRVGCSGWMYDEWRPRFYPATLAKRRWLAHYASRFTTVEINSSFYRLPEVTTFENWARQVPRSFEFAVKASRYLTHFRKLKEPRDPLDRLLLSASGLGAALGPLLYQLPPDWRLDLPRLRAFLDALPHSYRVDESAPALELRHVLEIRDPTWYTDGVFEALRARRVALCVHDRLGSTSPRLVVGPFLYVRFHGTTGAYSGQYGPDRLTPWADWIADHAPADQPIYAYFNNDIGGDAPADAHCLRDLLVERGFPSP